MNIEELGLKYLENKDKSKQIKEEMDSLKKDILENIEVYGLAVEGSKHKKYYGGTVEILKEVRITESVNKDSVLLLRNKNLIEEIESESIISLCKGVKAEDIPVELLSQIEKYFAIDTREWVERDTLRKLRKSEALTEEEYNSCISTKESIALKVKKI
jgi:hypothetical protein